MGSFRYENSCISFSSGQAKWSWWRDDSFEMNQMRRLRLTSLSWEDRGKSSYFFLLSNELLNRTHRFSSYGFTLHKITMIPSGNRALATITSEGAVELICFNAIFSFQCRRTTKSESWDFVYQTQLAGNSLRTTKWTALKISPLSTPAKWLLGTENEHDACQSQALWDNTFGAKVHAVYDGNRGT